MHRINPAKLHHSKWTAVKPQRKEKHFLISEVEFDEDGSVSRCVLESVMSKNEYEINWRELKDSSKWQQGWK
ncbi:TIGR02450 family Trp-rich protein [Vibrio sp. MarTm2]|uniref:TIGR02450 family Trp-rich protein n=1 Tax=Vibrio sp. MarTm2 TaxID=2998831 RepID=UPI0022CD64F6|nr:TIGR02450 family Trp-rich protein [Vibrio sp. MarTm2]MDA0128314.1 TIGR02450 family Trp-rich protein [Vibrio sp. MarTm2]